MCLVGLLLQSEFKFKRCVCLREVILAHGASMMCLLLLTLEVSLYRAAAWFLCPVTSEYHFLLILPFYETVGEQEMAIEKRSPRGT